MLIEEEIALCTRDEQRDWRFQVDRGLPVGPPHPGDPKGRTASGACGVGLELPPESVLEPTTVALLAPY